MSEWIDVVAVDALTEGDYARAEIDGVNIAVYKLGDDFYAIEDICSHDGSEIAGGLVVDGCIECPRHGARFDIRTGGVTAPPAYEPIDVFPVRIIEGNVQVRDDRWD